MGPESQQQITIDRGEQLLSAQQPHCKNLLHLFCSTSRTRDSSGSQLRPSQEALNCMLYNITLWHWTKRFHTDYLTERSQWRDIGAHSTFEKIKTRRGSTMWLGSSKSKAWSQDPCPLTVEWVLNFDEPLNQVHFFLTKNKCQFPWLYPRLTDIGAPRGSPDIRCLKLCRWFRCAPKLRTTDELERQPGGWGLSLWWCLSLLVQESYLGPSHRQPHSVAPENLWF